MSPDRAEPGQSGRGGRARSARTGRFRADERRAVLRRTVLTFSRGEGVDAAAALTYYACLALFPIALTLVSALALVTGRGRAIDALLDAAGLLAGRATVDALRAPLVQLTTIPAPGVALAVGLVLTLWAVSAYAECFGRTLNGFYGVAEGRPVWRSRPAMVLLSVPLIAGLLLCAGLVLATPQLVGALAARAGVEGPWLVAVQIAKWPVIAGLCALMLAALYAWSPNVRRGLLGPMGLGALVAVTGCVAATAAFALYLSTVGHYDAVYGWLSVPLVVLIWMYLIDLVLVYGAALDTEVARMHRLRAGEHAESRLAVPLRDTTRSDSLARREDAAEAEARAVRGRYAAGPPVTVAGMSRKDPEGTPALEAVEQDFTMPDDADLKPVDDGEVDRT